MHPRVRPDPFDRLPDSAFIVADHPEGWWNTGEQRAPRLGGLASSRMPAQYVPLFVYGYQNHAGTSRVNAVRVYMVMNPINRGAVGQ